MKRSLLYAAMLFMFATTSQLGRADNEWLNVFRNDGMFSTYELKAIDNLEYIGSPAQGFDYLLVSSTDGRMEKLPLEGIDSMRIGRHVPELYFTLKEYPDFPDLITSWGKKFEYAATAELKGHGVCDDLPLQDVTLRGRGNSTWYMPKKPYRFKMAKKTALCGMKKAKTFAVIANYIDHSLMHNVVAFWIARRLGMPFAQHAEPCDVYLNGNYRGSYFLTEKIGIGSGSVDIDENTGMLFELDTNYDEDYKFMYHLYDYTVEPSGSGVEYLPVMCKDPDLVEIMQLRGEANPKEAAEQYFDQWTVDFVEMLNAVMKRPSNQPISDVIDLQQCVAYFIVQCVANNHEMQHPKSLYVYKESIGSDHKYVFGPDWDFDWAFTYASNGTNPSNACLLNSTSTRAGKTFLTQLFSNQEFMTAFKERFNRFVEEDYDDLMAYIDQYSELIEPSARMNGMLWPDDYSQPALSSYDHPAARQELKNWIRKRINFMKAHTHCGLY